MSSAIRSKILARLQAGPVEAENGTLHIEGVDPEQVHQTLVMMNDRNEIGVHGASNGNSDFGADPEIFFRKI
jgi:hypothetical protein